MEATIWALLPPLIAIVASVITKEINLSLFLGLAFGIILYTGFDIFNGTETMFNIMSSEVHDNFEVLIFIVLLGMIVYLMNLSGATHKYGKWASKKIKNKKQSLLATAFLGIIIFLDDYFNCLTVGTIMKPITDRYKVSREKLAYIIDCTAAPVCMIAPLSSWAAAVATSLPSDSKIDGFQLFIKTISSNYYSLFTILFVFLTIIFGVDYGKMKKYEMEAEKKKVDLKNLKIIDTSKGETIDLILPIIFLIIFAIIGMLYTGKFFKGNVSLINAFANCDAITALAMSALYTVIFAAILYLPRKVVKPKQYLDGLVEGFKQMVPATLILILAWSLGKICGPDYLNAGGFISEIVSKYNISLSIVPFIIFIMSVILSFSTGTSWGTFAILLPIVVSIFQDKETTLMILSTAAVLGGSVCGDHLSPISDTTILSSTGAECNHLNHVESQLQYGLIVASISSICYLIAGLTKNNLLGLLIGIIFLICLVTYTKIQSNEKNIFLK